MTALPLVLGLMAGTSLDGIDATLVRSDGRTLRRLGCGATTPYAAETRELLERAVALGERIEREPALVAALDARVADEHAAAARRLLGEIGAGGRIDDTFVGDDRDDAARDVARDDRRTVSLVGFHGQTVWHAPERGRSVQLGDPARLARALGIDVVARLRDADIAAGGEGAPLAPVYHRALLAALGERGPAAFLNVGGVANLTLVDGEALIGFDCGPGNAPLDALARRHAGVAFDTGGERAARGTADEAAVRELLADPFFARSPPKSLDRERFATTPAMRRIEALAASAGTPTRAGTRGEGAEAVAAGGRASADALDDALATLAAFVAAAVARGLAFAPRPPALLVVAGGGQHNRAIVDRLRGLGVARVATADELGLPGDLIEAELVAFLAARHVAGLATSFPGTTGVASPVVGGRLFRAVSARSGEAR